MSKTVTCDQCGADRIDDEPHECPGSVGFSTPGRIYPGGAVKYTDDNEILREANTAVTDRAGVYGGANAMAAEMFSGYLGVTVTERDVCALMSLLKTARQKATPDHRDSWVDIAGYAALGGGAER